MTEKGRYALDLICQHYLVEGESFTAADLSEKSGKKVSASTLKKGIYVNWTLNL